MRPPDPNHLDVAVATDTSGQRWQHLAWRIILSFVMLWLILQLG